MQSELDLKSYWQHEGLEQYRNAVELDATEFKAMDIECYVLKSTFDEVFNPAPGFTLNTLIGGEHLLKTIYSY